nr:MAG TPA: hypothetical protein [Caudoviricetes sp.]
MAGVLPAVWWTRVLRPAHTVTHYSFIVCKS